MDWERETRTIAYYRTTPLQGFVSALILWLMLLLLVGAWLYRHIDVDGNPFSIKKQIRQRQVRLPRIPNELVKLRRTPVWIAFFILPLLAALIGTFNYVNNLKVLQDGWYSLWSQHTLFLCFLFLPALLGVYCSCLWRMERANGAIKTLLVFQSPFQIIAGKLLSSLFMLLVTLLWITLLYFFCGKIAGLTAPLPHELPAWLLCGFGGGIAVCAAQCFLSLALRSFAVPIALALAGSVAGLALTSQGRWYFLPYSLLSVGMRANNPHYELDLLIFASSCIVMTLLFTLLSVLLLKRE